MILFIIKRHGAYGDYGGYGGHPISNGLRKSAQFVVDLLNRLGYSALLVDAVDGNSIDRLISIHRPARVVLEAIWVTPAKLAELQRLWPKVRWTVRVHSEIPFLAQEGMAVAWLVAYRKLGVELAFNSDHTAQDFGLLDPAAIYLPNYYPLGRPAPRLTGYSCLPLHIGCFGAIRPLKNQLIQAFAAIQFGRQQRRGLCFHMNGSRIEQNGSNNLKNISALFGATPDARLILHPWMDHAEFLELVWGMDLCMQVSLSESFCITAADAVGLNVPLVGSSAIRWLPRYSRADRSSVDSIVRVMSRAGKVSAALNRRALAHYLRRSSALWNLWAAGK